MPSHLLALAEQTLSEIALPAPTKVERPWEEWEAVARKLRSEPARRDLGGRPQPMTWPKVAEWILTNDPVRGEGLLIGSLASELSARISRQDYAAGTRKPRRKAHITR